MDNAQPSPPPAHGLRLDNFALAVGDLERMIGWYETVLGFVVAERGRFDAVGADYAMLDAGGLRLELVSRAGIASRPVDRTPPPAHLNVLGWKALVLRTDGLTATTARLNEHRVETVWANQPLTPELSSTLIRDPEGNLINVFGPNR
jgi:glyoxylase I family protein